MSNIYYDSRPTMNTQVIQVADGNHTFTNTKIKSEPTEELAAATSQTIDNCDEQLLQQRHPAEHPSASIKTEPCDQEPFEASCSNVRQLVKS